MFPVRTDSTFKKYWAKARVALGIPRLRPHDLRVMFARETHSRGADLKAVQGLLGHSTPTMTMHYIPADLHPMRAAVRVSADLAARQVLAQCPSRGIMSSPSGRRAKAPAITFASGGFPPWPVANRSPRR